MTASEDELWGLAFKRLVRWAMKRHRLNPADAEEMVQEAIAQFINAGGQADPQDLGALLRNLGSRVNGIAINNRRKKASKAVGLTHDGEPAEPAPPADPETVPITADTAQKSVSVLLGRIEKDVLVTALVMQMAEGVDLPADQAKALGVAVGEIYKARKRLQTHVDAVNKLREDW